MAPQSRTASSQSHSEPGTSSRSQGGGASSAGATHGSECVHYTPGETIIFVEWDDLIFPTQYLIDQGLVTSGNFVHGHLKLPHTPEQVEALRRIGGLVEELLRLATERGRVVIISTGPDYWVPQSCHWFMPNVVPLLAQSGNNNILVLYTPSFSYEYGGLEDVNICKTRALAHGVMEYYYSTFLSLDSRLNMLSLEIGPPFALDAVADGTGAFDEIRRKTVGFKVASSAHEVREKLEWLLPQFTRLIGCNSSWTGEDLVLR